MTRTTQYINIFDFDGTLTNDTWPKFWVWVKRFGYQGISRNADLEDALAEYRSKNVGNPLETFYAFFNDLLSGNNATITLDELMEGEKHIVYNPGVIDFLETSEIKNYIITGGLKEFVENLRIAKHFEGVYGTQVIFNQEGKIPGIGEPVTDDKKVDAIRDILRINGRVDEDCRGVIFVGDGYSDADSLRYVHEHGGISIFVHQPNNDDFYFEHNRQVYEILNKDGMIDYNLLADYRSDTPLGKILRRKD